MRGGEARFSATCCALTIRTGSGELLFVGTSAKAPSPTTTSVAAEPNAVSFECRFR